MTSAEPAPRTLCEAFRRTAARHPEARALGNFDGRGRLSWGEYLARVDRIAGALHTLGVRRGDTVGLMMVNRPEFHLCDTAALHLGATPFSIYNTSSAEQIQHLFADAGNEVVITEPQFVPRLLEAGARTVVSVTACPDALDLADLEAAADPTFDVEVAWRAVEPDDLATLIYTSGTTGPPKGVECTHAQLLAECEAFGQLFQVGANDVLLSFLPAAHITERALSHYIQLCSGASVVSVPDPRAVGRALPLVCPTVFLAVPSVWQRMRGAIEMAMATDPMLVVGIEAKEPDVLTGVLHRLGLDWARLALTGAAPIAPETLKFLTALGVPIFEGWGMSEVCGAGLINLPGHNRVGTVGRPMPGCEVKLADDGELLFAGPIVMRGYRNRPDATAEAIDADGWLHTGDIATIDADGYVTIVDRKKEIIINAAGKNMSPANIETTIRAAAPLIGQAVTIGDARNYVTALLVLDPEATARWAAGQGIDESSPKALCSDPRLLQVLAERVRIANDRLSRVEQIKRFRVLPDVWAPGDDVLTPTMKLRRREIAARYAAEIEEMYLPEPSPSVVSFGAEQDK